MIGPGAIWGRVMVYYGGEPAFAEIRRLLTSTDRVLQSGKIRRIMVSFIRPGSYLAGSNVHSCGAFMETKLYVGNLPYSTTEEDLRTLFSQAGAVKSVELITDRETGRSKGFAFVEMGTQAEAQKAISQFNGYELQERALRVNLARPREERGGRGGGERRGGYGGGGGSGYGGGGGGGGDRRGGYGGGGGSGYGGGGGGDRRGGGQNRGGGRRQSSW